MPQSKVNLKLIVDHPSKNSSNILVGLDVDKITKLLCELTGATSIIVDSGTAVPHDGYTASSVGSKKERLYPA